MTPDWFTINVWGDGPRGMRVVRMSNLGENTWDQIRSWVVVGFGSGFLAEKYLKMCTAMFDQIYSKRNWSRTEWNI